MPGTDSKGNPGAIQEETRRTGHKASGRAGALLVSYACMVDSEPETMPRVYLRRQMIKHVGSIE